MVNIIYSDKIRLFDAHAHLAKCSDFQTDALPAGKSRDAELRDAANPHLLISQQYRLQLAP